MATNMTEIKSMIERITLEMGNVSMRQTQIEDHHEKSFAILKESLEAAKMTDKGKKAEIETILVRSPIKTKKYMPLCRPHQNN
ncbi:hypothetical protein H5410_023366 [Solanum commersonii]|uniref:Uncharacterized protein n=1 Tax=Solanum commersonii TaxID=4109 RepID=A0A9J5ZI21_SOLCO|nr:hypothetical protein H5410_023366 [Solanum commersonii]